MLIRLTQYPTGKPVYVPPGAIAKIEIIQEGSERDGKTAIYLGTGTEHGFIYNESPIYIKEEMRKIKEKELEDLAEMIVSKLRTYPFAARF